MFGFSILSDCCVVAWQQFLFVFTLIYHRLTMFLGRSESLKWIRRKFTKRHNNSCNTATAPIEHTPAKISRSANEINENIRDLNEILVVRNSSKVTTTSDHSELGEAAIAATSSSSSSPTPSPLTTNPKNNECPTRAILSSPRPNQFAPIACEEDSDEMEEKYDDNLIDNNPTTITTITHNHNDDVKINSSKPRGEEQHQSLSESPQLHPIDLLINENASRRSSKSSRVRNYWRRCKDRWLTGGTAGGGHANAEQNAISPSTGSISIICNNTNTNMGHDSAIIAAAPPPPPTPPPLSMSTMGESNVSKQERWRPMPIMLTTVISSANTTKPMAVSEAAASTLGDEAAGAGITDNQDDSDLHSRSRHQSRYTNCALGCVEEMEDDDVDADSYEDIDFGLVARDAIDTSSMARQSNGVMASARTAQIQRQTKAKKSPHQLAQSLGENHDDGANNNDPAAVDSGNLKRDGIEEKQLADPMEKDIELVALIDSHLSSIYPIYTQTTRTVLVREARDLLHKNYHSSLTMFQHQYLCRFTEIAAILKERHRIGEALIWCQGWPLVTPNGEVILHLGGLDDDQLKPAEIYLCVQPTDETNSEPHLYATWRTPISNKVGETNTTLVIPANANSNTSKSSSTPIASPSSGSTLKSCQLNIDDNALYLSPISLEMLNDDLPQLLQNLLIGVEESLERLSLNQLPPQTASTYSNDGDCDAAKTSLLSSTCKDADQVNDNDKPSLDTMIKTTMAVPNSPKCILRRSELITKNNKLHNNKYMLRRFTYRQDSMNSTSSGNSSASGLSNASSNSSDSRYPKIHLNHINKNNNQQNGRIPQPETKSNDPNTSPALPRFCLGTSFPHIDSDEENAEDRRNSLTEDQLENEIVAPNLITDLPEKLLLSGIYLPGTHDLKGNPLVTVDAENVLAAGLNCYEIATLLLYYSTIPDCSPPRSSLNHSAEVATTIGTQSPTSSTSTAASASSTLTTSATIVNATCTSLNDNRQQKQSQFATQQLQQQQQQQEHGQHVTFTILIAIEKSEHLCVIDLISQSLRLLTRHIAYCNLLVVCLDSSLMQSPKIDNGVGVTTTQPTFGSTVSATVTTETTTGANDDVKSSLPMPSDIMNGPASSSPSTIDSNGNWRCQKETETHTITFIGVDEVTANVSAIDIPSGRLGGLHYHDARKWREFFVHYEPFYQQCAGAAHRLMAALNDIRHADLQGLPTRRQLYAQHRALSRALMDSELHNLRKRSATTMARLQELAKGINHTNQSNINNNYTNSKVNGYSSLKTKMTMVASAGVTSAGYYSSSSTLNRNKIMGTGMGSSYSFNYQGNQNNKNHNNGSNNNNNNNAYNSQNVTTTTTTNKSISTSLSNQTSTSISNGNHPPPNTIKSSIYASSSPSSASISNNPASRPSTTIKLFSSCNTNNIPSTASPSSSANMDVSIRLQKVTLLFNEIDRTTKRLEQLTEQRREHLRDLTRQRALEDEINQVTSWITNDGSECLQRFINLELDMDTPIKEREQDFEKYYFISMKNLAKGRDLHVAAANMGTLHDSAIHLRQALDNFAEKLETARERIEGQMRLHQLLHSGGNELGNQQEMENLAEKYGVKGLLEKYRNQEHVIDGCNRRKRENLNLSYNNNNNSNNVQKTTNVMSQMIINSTPDIQKMRSLCHRSSSYGTGSYDSPNTCHCWRDSRNLDYMEDEMLDNDEEEGRSKIADSGVGECQRCDGNPKLTRICSCQSLNEDNDNLFKKTDGLDDECFEQPSKCYINNIHSPLEANKHLQCFASTFELPKLDELSCLDPKIQKTLLLIMREMIGTERDYVRSLYYVIENYIDELLRDDIPQSLRGQRNVIFGNIEKIFEFHNNHFLTELERYENNPLKVGAAFLQMESKFYLYALYNKNKPKSDTLMSEYGTAFFKSKQMELNDKMDLASYLLKPVQRMGKYALLLQQLVKACSSVEGSALQEIAADVEELQKAEEMVKFQLRHGNDLLAMDSLRDSDVNVKEQGRLLRQNEFLVWQGRGGKKTLRHIFLFEELVLFSKSRRFPDHKNLDIYIYKNSIKTSDIGLTAHVGDSPTKFEIWFRKRKPEDTWTLQCMSEDIKNAWTEEISKLLWTQAKRNREIRLAEMSSMGIGSKPCLDIRPSNNQINDRSITISQLGKAPKLRHSFVGLQSDQTKGSRRPTSLISESSLSSGTSSSSLSKSSCASSTSSGHNHNQPSSGLELINESQALDCENSFNHHQQHHHHIHNQNMNNGNGSISGSANPRIRNNHKRSIVSQMSMDALVSPANNNNGNKFLLKCPPYTMAKKFDSLHHQQQPQYQYSKTSDGDSLNEEQHPQS
ncbi:puratrophin-1-like isoform X2 [Haematobia irritans]|uniref:puratrophin-1-like isoform X2 n=1 Tax=Haematobia irritans TaxID=7368 RepID=UPI003F4FD2C2